MSTGEFVSLSVCTDCTMFIANGDCPAELDEDETSAWVAGIESNCGLDTARHLIPGGDDLGFSFSRCDCCDSGLGGDRFSAWLAVEVAR